MLVQTQGFILWHETRKLVRTISFCFSYFCFKEKTVIGIQKSRRNIETTLINCRNIETIVDYLTTGKEAKHIHL